MNTQHTMKLLLLAAIWGASYPIMKTLTPTLGIVGTFGARVTLASAALLISSPFNGAVPNFRKSWKHYLILGGLSLAIPGMLVIFSVQQLSASMGAVLNATTPMFTLFVGAIWLKQKITMQQLVGLLLGMLGITILVGWNPTPLSTQTWLAYGGSLLAALSYGIGTNYARKHANRESALQSTNGLLLGAALLIAPLYIAQFKMPAINTVLVLKMAFFALVSTALGYIIFLKLVARLGSVKTSMVTILVPVFGIIWSALFLDESINAEMVVGIILIAASVGLVISTKRISLVPDIDIRLPKGTL
jgi:drug/metabolite transporter (DMT)-like permease